MSAALVQLGSGAGRRVRKAMVLALSVGTLTATALLPSQALAQEPTSRSDKGAARHETRGGKLVKLQADAQRDVSNDTLIAQFYVEASDTVASRVANALNRAINEALGIVGDDKAVRVRSGNSQTFPVYDRNQRLTGWRGRAELRIETRDFQLGAALIGKLQSADQGLQMSGMDFRISPAARRVAEDELVAEAVAAFRARADVVRVALGGKKYRIRRLGIETGGVGAPRPLAMRSRVSSVSQEFATPQLEGGLSQVSVSVSGEIEVD